MEKENIRIRRVGKDDVDAFRHIRLEALRLEPASFASTFEDWHALPSVVWQQRLNEPVFIAFQSEDPVGLIGLLREKGARSAHRATIVMVYLRKNLRGRGIARELFTAIEKFARDIGVRQLELTVSAENSVAISFYQREGFVEVGRVPGAYIHEGREIDDVLMVRRLML